MFQIVMKCSFPVALLKVLNRSIVIRANFSYSFLTTELNGTEQGLYMAKSGRASELWLGPFSECRT